MSEKIEALCADLSLTAVANSQPAGRISLTE